MINILWTCGIFRREALAIFLNSTAFEVSNQRTVDSLAAVIGDYGPVSQICNVQAANENKRVYDVLGTFPNLKRLDIDLGGLRYCCDLEKLLEIRKGALLMDCGYNADPEPGCTLFDILSPSLYGFTELILNRIASESPHLF